MKVSPLAKRIIFTVIGLIVLIGILIGIKAIEIVGAIKKLEGMKPPPALVSTAPVKVEKWSPYIGSVGTITAVQGVDLSPQVTGIVTKINFKSGQKVKKGQVLVRLDTQDLQAQLDRYTATLKLAHIAYNRQAKLYKQHAASQADYDSAFATLKEDEATVSQYQALLAQKTIRAPFSGMLGIREVSLGQFLNAGTTITSLQTIAPIYVDYLIPQNKLADLHVGQKVEVMAEAFGSHPFVGKVTAISPKIGEKTRSVSVRAVLANQDKKGQLLPGMFVTVHTMLPVKNQVITVPQMAITYSLYGNSIYVVKPNPKHKGGYIAVEEQVTTGQKRGTQIEVLKGLKKTDMIVTAGQIKLHNGAEIVLEKHHAKAKSVTAKHAHVSS